MELNEVLVLLQPSQLWNPSVTQFQPSQLLNPSVSVSVFILYWVQIQNIEIELSPQTEEIEHAAIYRFGSLISKYSFKYRVISISVLA